MFTELVCNPVLSNLKLDYKETQPCTPTVHKKALESVLKSLTSTAIFYVSEEKLVSKMTYYLPREMINCTHSLTTFNRFKISSVKNNRLVED